MYLYKHEGCYKEVGLGFRKKPLAEITEIPIELETLLIYDAKTTSYWSKDPHALALSAFDKSAANIDRSQSEQKMSYKLDY